MGVSNSNTRATNAALTMVARGVLAPACSLTAERENPPDTGKALKNAPTKLASPSDISSMLAFTLYPLLRTCSDFEMEMDSRNPTRATMNASGMSDWILAMEMPGY